MLILFATKAFKLNFQVRKTTADQLYSAALTFDDIIPAERLDDVLAILSETSW